ncbi:unnamed protein product [Lactuca saligna]|uniref:Uncharacterized protein n=1 Tax=Lactuca saligna TaxID=75948 RepID=A0AA36E000_LACSI|nr:unnamed protein product [Lactuca saligna]
MPTELSQMRPRRRKTSLSWVQYRRIINMFVPNNQPVVVVANEMEIMWPFYIHYVNWTLNQVESSPRQQIPPPIVASSPRRNKYKSETSSIETTTSVYTSQQPQVERSHMSSDTSTRSVKKKKTSLKKLMKHLIGIVAELTSKIDSKPKLKKSPNQGKNKAVECPEKTNKEIVNEDIGDVSNHRLLDSLHATSTLGFWKEWNTTS